MRRLRENRGLTMVEVVVATAVVAMLGVAIGGAAEVILATDREADDSAAVTELGLALLEEVASLPFDDPQNGETTLGPEFGEWTPLGTRANLDDVDDYTVVSGGQGPTANDGAPLDLDGYTRSVAIEYVTADDFNQTSVTPTDYKRITVRVYKDGSLTGTFVTVRAQGGRDVDIDG
jgi:prepilin-type N-terminal cleavage/methylation domain-containing protein